MQDRPALKSQMSPDDNLIVYTYQINHFTLAYAAK